MNIKVHGGTRSGEQLCKTCDSGVTVKGHAESEEFFYCHALGVNGPKAMTIRVTQCSSYRNRSDTSLHEMKQISWVITTDKAKGKMGFLTPKEFRATDKHADPVDDK